MSSLQSGESDVRLMQVAAADESGITVEGPLATAVMHYATESSIKLKTARIVVPHMEIKEDEELVYDPRPGSLGKGA